MTEDEFRRLALALPGAVEGAHMAHPDFRVGGKIFASLSGKDPVAGMVKLPLDVQAAVLAESPAVYFPASGAWGRGGATMVRLAGARVPSVRRALSAAYESAMKAAAERGTGARRRGVSVTRKRPARGRPRPPRPGR